MCFPYRNARHELRRPPFTKPPRKNTTNSFPTMFHTSRTDDLYDLYDVYDLYDLFQLHDVDLSRKVHSRSRYSLAQIAGWEDPYILQVLPHVSWVGCVICRSCTTSHNGTWGTRWSRSRSVLWCARFTAVNLDYAPVANCIKKSSRQKDVEQFFNHSGRDYDPLIISYY